MGPIYLCFARCEQTCVSLPMSELGQNRLAVTGLGNIWSDSGREISCLGHGGYTLLCLSNKETDHGRPS